MAERKLDIFDLLSKIDSPAVTDVWMTLTEEQRKEVAPLVIMRWMTGCDDEQQLVLLNEFANSSVFTLGKHPQLLLRILQACSTKTRKRYKWNPFAKTTKNVHTRRVLSEYYDYSSRELDSLTVLPSPDELLSMAEYCGWPQDEIKLLKRELS